MLVLLLEAGRVRWHKSNQQHDRSTQEPYTEHTCVVSLAINEVVEVPGRQSRRQ